MYGRLTAIFAAAVFAIPAFAAAQSVAPVPTETVKRGLPVSVIDDSGTRVEGHVVDISDDAIRVSVRDKRVEEIPLQRVVRIDKTDSLKNGAVTGLVAGVGFGLLVGMSSSGFDGRWLASAVISNGLMWTAFGAGIDALADSRRTLYQRAGSSKARISPLLGRDVRGAALTVSW
jgi:hypothetical protein